MSVVVNDLSCVAGLISNNSLAHISPPSCTVRSHFSSDLSRDVSPWPENVKFGKDWNHHIAKVRFLCPLTLKFVTCTSTAPCFVSSICLQCTSYQQPLFRMTHLNEYCRLIKSYVILWLYSSRTSRVLLRQSQLWEFSDDWQALINACLCYV